jgi:hypothetical protein
MAYSTIIGQIISDNIRDVRATELFLKASRVVSLRKDIRGPMTHASRMYLSCRPYGQMAKLTFRGHQVF